LGLDIYVGSFTRYFSGDWELAAARVARETGATFSVVRQHDPEDAVRDPEQLRPIILQWRTGLAEALSKLVPEPFDWSEEADTPYFTDKPAWDGYQSLLLWAAYEEHPELHRPDHIPEDWTNDAAIQLSMGGKTRYPALLSNVEFWLPVPFSIVFDADSPSGKKITMASSYALAQQLRELNDRTWKVTDSEMDHWTRQNFEYGAPIEEGARFAYALFQRHANLSVMHRLPMLLDY